MDFIDLDNNKTENELAESTAENEEKPVKGLFKRGIFNELKMVLFFSGLIFYLETVYHVWAFQSFSNYLWLKLLFSFMTGTLISLFTVYFPKVLNKIFTGLFTALFIILSVVNILYHSIFKVFFSIEFVDKNNARVVQYYREIIEGIKTNALVLSLSVFVPIIVIILLSVFKLLNYEPAGIKAAFLNPLLLIILIASSLFIVPLFGDDITDPLNVLKYDFNLDLSVEEVGVFTTHQVEIINMLFPKEEKLEEFEAWVYEEPEEVESVNTENPESTDAEDNLNITEEPVVKEIDRSPNILDIDFVKLAEEEPDENIANIHSYLSSVAPTFKNEYTGLFKGYNLILLTCEGFSSIAVDETHTPTLYRLTHEGFVFNNFYNPRTGGSTSDGEFVINTSLHPTNGGAKNFKIVGQNNMAFSLGHYFNREYDITSRAYHDNDFQYYGRDITYPGMGYYYTGVGNGMDIEKHWPESDLQMMEDTVPDYIDDEVFNVYYMTVSGHMNYSFAGNWCSKIHREEVEDLPYSDKCKAYIACQMELDRALEYLLKQLEEKGIADRTVICFTGDHWPYGLDDDWNTYPYFSEILGHQVDTTFELYKSNLVLWCGSIKEPIIIDKPCCSMDIVPTLLNLFGFDYDSRLYMGRDILSDSEGFVGMFDKSFITDKVMYKSKTKEVINLTDEELPEDYVKNLKNMLANKWKYSDRIIDYDYYKYVADALNIQVKEPKQNYFVDYSKFNP